MPRMVDKQMKYVLKITIQKICWCFMLYIYENR
jgi:hypothetical protein